MLRKSKANDPEPEEDIFEEVEEVEVGKETTDLKEMKSDLRSLHVMVEVLLEKIEALEQEVKKQHKTASTNTDMKKRPAGKKVTPDSKRQKNAKIDEVYQRIGGQTMTQAGHVTVFGTTKTGARL